MALCLLERRLAVRIDFLSCCSVLADDVFGSGFQMVAQRNKMLIVRGINNGLMKKIIFFDTRLVTGNSVFHANQRTF